VGLQEAKWMWKITEKTKFSQREPENELIREIYLFGIRMVESVALDVSSLSSIPSQLSESGGRLQQNRQSPINLE